MSTAQSYQKEISSQRASSASQFLAMLSDNILEKQVYALRKIAQIVDYQWPEISDQLPRIESLIEEENFPEKKLAASIASKVFYFLQEHDEALRLALEAGELFDIKVENLYTETLVHKCIDLYIQKRIALNDHQDASVQVDPRMESIVNHKFEQCYREGNYKHVIGVAIDARRLDAIQQAIESSSNPEALLGYTFTVATETLHNKDFQQKILRMILLIYSRRQSGVIGSTFDYYKIAKCQFHLNMPEMTAQLLETLLQNIDNDDYLIAYQIAFDIIDKEQQVFTTTVINHIQGEAGKILNKERLSNLLSILKGQVKERLTLQFLKKNNYSDMLLIQKVKEAIPVKNSMLHSAVIWMNGMMNAYTTNDAFIKDNMNWVSQATNWNRFQATASLGMIHMLNPSSSREVLDPYLAGVGVNGGTSSPFATGGAYFAYGLIHANQYSTEVGTFLKDGLRQQDENVQHGVSLGLGLVGMATKDADLYDTLKNTLYNNANSAIIGEAAAFGMGLVMIGSADGDVIEEMITHAADSNHEKIIRALGISLSLVMYGKESGADALIEQMSISKDSTIRYGAMFTIGCAYAGTGNSKAIRQLLKFAVSDTSDDVKRAALMNIGFLHFRDYKQLPVMLKHLSVSYNPHMRYGAALGLGIGCAGTGSQDALRILAPLTKDKVDFVRQGALIALAMIFIQVTDVQEPKVSTIRKLFEKMIGNKYEEILSRVGAIISNGIINAAGRNSTISMTTHDGNLRQNAVVGLVLFLQHWYWYPMLNFLTLALTPTTYIAVNHKLKVPKSFNFTVKATPSTYRYPELLKKKEEKAKEKVETAVLSTTAKVKARNDRKAKAEGGDVEMSVIDQTEVDKEEKKDGEPTKPEIAEAEPTEYVVHNPTRVLKAQESKIIYHNDAQSLYQPVMANRFSGFVVLRETRELRDGEIEEFYDDEERNFDAPNPDLVSDLKIPAAFEFNEDIQNAV